MRPSQILDTVSRAAFPPVLVFSLYLLFVGHNAPGGGFVSGLTAGIAVVLLYAGGGIDRVREVIDVDYRTVLGAGLLLAGVTGLGSLALGEPFLSSAILEREVPVLGDVKLVTVLFFDIGVDLIVIGLALALVTILGAYSRDPREDPSAHERESGADGAPPSADGDHGPRAVAGVTEGGRDA
jgi:multicomponent Na+:H+ antiporter subunit A